MLEKSTPQRVKNQGYTVVRGSANLSVLRRIFRKLAALPYPAFVCWSRPGVCTSNLSNVESFGIGVALSSAISSGLRLPLSVGAGLVQLRSTHLHDLIQGLAEPCFWLSRVGFAFFLSVGDCTLRVRLTDHRTSFMDWRSLIPTPPTLFRKDCCP
jgi:hypothetical protein